MHDKIDDIILKYENLTAQLNAPETYENPALVARLNKEQQQLAPLVETGQALRRSQEARMQAETLLSDPELGEIAREEYAQAKEDCVQLEEKLKLLLLPRDPDDDKNVVMEIRAGVGGEEAALFAHSLA